MKPALPSRTRRVVTMALVAVGAFALLATPAAAHDGHGGAPGHSHAAGTEGLAGALPIILVVTVALAAGVLFLRSGAKDRS
jgi:hypothetical protein